ncbi:MAG: type II toxin-antitoxin system Phd/YefM family antitoxin [bacterium]
MTILSIAEARIHFADAINKVSYGGERIVVERRGTPVAALVSAKDLELLRRFEDATDARDALKALRDYERNPKSAMTLEDYKRTRKARA